MNDEFTNKLSGYTASLEQDIVDLIVVLFENRAKADGEIRHASMKNFVQIFANADYCHTFLISVLRDYTDFSFYQKTGILDAIDALNSLTQNLDNTLEHLSESCAISALSCASQILPCFTGEADY